MAHARVSAAEHGGGEPLGVADGHADADDVHEMYRQLAFAMVELEDAATTHDALDDTTPQSKAIDEARKAIFYLSKDNGSDALRSLDAAADHAEAAYSDD